MIWLKIVTILSYNYYLFFFIATSVVSSVAVVIGGLIFTILLLIVAIKFVLHKKAICSGTDNQRK